MKIEQNFEVLGKLLTEETNTAVNNYEVDKKMQSFLQYVSENLYPVINDSSYENKTELLVKLKEAIREIEFMTRNAYLTHKRLIVIEGKKQSVPKWFEENGMKTYATFIRQNTNVPMVLTADEHGTHIMAQNKLENVAPLTQEEFQHVNQQLYKSGIDITQFVEAFYVATKSPFEHIAFIYLPQYVPKTSDIYSMLRNMAEISINIDPQPSYLKDYKVPQFTKANFIIGEGTIADATTLKSNETKALLAKFNAPVTNVKSHDLFIDVFSDYFIEMKKVLSREKSIVNGLSKDLVAINDELLEESILKHRKHLKKEASAHEKAHKKLLKQLEESEKLLCEIDELLLLNDEAPYAYKAIVLTAKRALVALQTGKKSLYKQLLEKLTVENHMYSAIIATTAKSKMKVEYLQYLQKLTFNDVTAYLLLVHFEHIKSEALFKRLKQYYQHNYTAYINTYLGKASIAMKATNDIQKYFKRAINQGSSEAAELLLPYVNKKDIKEIENLARLLVPEACYIAGQYYLNTKYGKAITFFKIAATFEYLPAMKELAKIEFDHFNKARNSEKDEDKLNVIFSNALRLNLYLYEQKQTKQVSTRIGKLYYWVNDYRRAESFLEQVDNGECNYLLGKMYQYGDVIPKNLQKSKAYFQKSVNQGYLQAEAQLSKVTGWIRAENAKQSSSSGNSYRSTSSTSSYSSGKSSKCFLTTATCLALGKEDNCDEIMQYKAYRDNHLRYDDDGNDLIIEYYRIAPGIVDQIDASPNAKQIYLDLYERYIKIGYSYLKQRDLTNAKRIYIEMVKDLCEIYHIKPFEQ